MSYLSGFVFSETFIHFLAGFGIQSQKSDSVFSETAIRHRYVFFGIRREIHELHIYEIHDEIQFLQLSGRKKFQVTHEFSKTPTLSSEEEPGNVNVHFGFQEILTRESLDAEPAMDDSLKIYFEIRKKSPVYAVILKPLHSTKAGGLGTSLISASALRVFSWRGVEHRLISLGPDCFDILIQV